MQCSFFYSSAVIGGIGSMGADVTVVYRRGMEELPARKEEVHHAEEEGIVFKLLNNPVKILDRKSVV